MTPELRILSIWGGCALLVVIVGWMWLGSRADDLDNQRATAMSSHKEYQDLYPASGIGESEAIRAAQNLADHQAKEEKLVQNALVPDLPNSYQVFDVSGAGGLVHSELATLKQRAERQKIAMPTSLPFEQGLEADSSKRSMQLAQLYLYKNVLDLCMNVGVTKISSITAGKCIRSPEWRSSSEPTVSYAVLTCDFALESSYQACEQLLVELLRAHDKGIGLREVSVEQLKDGNERLTLTASLLTLNRSDWNLTEEAAPKGAASTTTTTNTGTTPPRGRGRGNQ